MEFELIEYRQGVTEEELIEEVKKCGAFKDKLRIILVALLPLIIFSCQSSNMEVYTEACISSYKINENHPKAEKLQEKLEEIVALDIPGAVIAIKDGSGTWAAAAGYAKTEDKVPMELCNLQFGQSVAKTYMAAAILLLYQDGEIDLDETIDTYLPDTFIWEQPINPHLKKTIN